MRNDNECSKDMVYELFLEILLWENDKEINFIDNFFIFSIKVTSKLFYYSLLTITLRALVNMTLIKLKYNFIEFNCLKKIILPVFYWAMQLCS